MGLTFVTSALPSSSVHIEEHKTLKLVRIKRLDFKESKQKLSVLIKTEPIALKVIGT